MEKKFYIKKWFQIFLNFKKFGSLKVLESFSPILKNRASDIIHIRMKEKSQFQDSIEKLKENYEEVYRFFNSKSVELVLPDHLFILGYRIEMVVVPLVFNQNVLSCDLYLENRLGGGYVLSSYIIKKSDLECYYWRDWVSKEEHFNLLVSDFLGSVTEW